MPLNITKLTAYMFKGSNFSVKDFRNMHFRYHGTGVTGMSFLKLALECSIMNKALLDLGHSKWSIVRVTSVTHTVTIIL